MKKPESDRPVEQYFDEASQPGGCGAHEVAAIEEMIDDYGPALQPRERLDGIVIGLLAGFDGEGRPLVCHRGSVPDETLPARSTAALDGEHVGREVALMFEEADPARPIVLGVIQAPIAGRATEAASSPAEAERARPVTVEADDERLVFSADREIVLRCGKASITLTRAGKILLRGAYVLSRSSGVNRIKGGSVQIN